MGSKGSKSPDYSEAAEKQAEASKDITRDQTWANRPNQYNPWGSTEWEATSVIDPSTGKPVTQWDQYEQLSPDAQNALDSQLALESGRSELAGGMMGRVGDEIGTTMDWDRFGNMTTVGDQKLLEGGQDFVDRAESAYYDRSTSRLDPQFSGEQEALEIKMKNQGLRAGDQAWDSAMESFNNRKTDAYQAATNEAIKAGGAEGARLQGMDLGTSRFNQDTMYRGSDYSNQLRAEAIKEEMTKRGLSLNEMNALISGQQVANPSFESFSQASKSETPQYNTAALNQGNFDQAQDQGFMSGVGGLVGTGAEMYMSGGTSALAK